jgi:hypothetical protein
MKHLAEDFKLVVRSPESKDTFCYSPGILKLDSGRLIATMDFSGPGVKRLEGCAQRWPGDRRYNLGKIFISDDDGDTWTEQASIPLICMRPFKAGKSIYVAGFLRDLGVARSDDDGETWTQVCSLTEGEFWHQGPTNVWYKDDNVYLVMERMTHTKVSWPICSIAPVLMRANVNTDLTKRENWTFASEIAFDEHVFENELKDFGVPFYNDDNSAFFAGSPCGWLETNVVQLKKENDIFYDKTGKTFHLFMRAWTGLPWTGALLKVVEKDDGSMETMFETAPSGKRMVFINIPGGGNSKFHILYDEKSKTYWLVTNQVTDSMIDYSTLTPAERHGHGRSRLVLYYSYNCFDWIFAGVVTTGKTTLQSRSYAAMQFDGDDLLLMVRTGDENTRSAHDTNMITYHKVKNFRDLIDD